MTSNVISIVLNVVTAILMVFFILSFYRLGSAKFNQACALIWLQSMDVVKDNQRYLGSRATVLADVDSGKKGALGYEVFLACRTPSRRAFYVSITSNFGQITAWDLIPVNFDEMIASLREADFDVTNVADVINSPKTHINRTVIETVGTII